jgi:hypothetical protein
MRIAEHLYFASNIRFSQVDLSGNALPEQFETRIRGFYLDPAISLAATGQAFASGALLVVTIDAIARLDGTKTQVGERIRDWCERRLPSLSTSDMRNHFNEDFRNGLVHEARVKNGSEFDLQERHAAIFAGGRLILNPGLLADEVSSGLTTFVATLQSDAAANQTFVKLFTSEFHYELTH